MEFIVYKFAKRQNSTKRPTTEPQMKLDGWHKKTTSLYAPTFTVTERLVGYSYLKWENMFYYITDIVFIRKDYYELVCELDVLATYKENILNTTAFVLYSSSYVDLQLMDTRISAVNTPTYSSAQALLINWVTSTSIDIGTYILTYVTDHPTMGGSGVVWATDVSLKLLGQKLTSTEFFGITNFDKQFLGCYDSLLSCKYLPFEIIPETPTSVEIRLGSYNTGINGAQPQKIISYSCDVDIPWNFNDYRNLPPFTSILVYLPVYGFIQLNPRDFIGSNKLHVVLQIDGITGIGTYIIGNVFRASCSLATDVAIGTVANSASGIINTGLQAVTTIPLLATGAVGAAAAATSLGAGLINGIISSQQRSIGNVGSNGGLSSIYATPADSAGSVKVIVISHDTNIPPTDFNTTNGGVCRKILKLNTLTGYCQTINASVDTPNNDATKKINAMLDGGIYLE